MLLKILIFTTAVTLSVLTSDALAWGCSRSCSGSGNYGGSFLYSSSSSGGYGSYSHSGSTTATGRYGNTYSGSLLSRRLFDRRLRRLPLMEDAMVAEGSMRRRLADRMAPPTQRGFIVVQFGESRRAGNPVSWPVRPSSGICR
jgi:hypothetical protein